MGEVLVQGCGLMYLDRGHARTPVVVEFGTPMLINQILARAGLATPLPPTITGEILEKITLVLQFEMQNVTVSSFSLTLSVLCNK
jgi:hypothetical protein